MYSKLFLVAIGLFHIIHQYNYGTVESPQAQVIDTNESPLPNSETFNSRALESKESRKTNILETLNKQMMNSSFVGNWTGSKPKNFRNSRGFAYLHYYPDGVEDLVLSFELSIYDNSYIGQDIVTISFMEDIFYIQDEFIEENSTLHLLDHLVTVSSGNAGGSASTLKECKANTMISFRNASDYMSFVTTYENTTLLKDLAVGFKIESLNCSLNITTSVLIREDIENMPKMSDYLIYSIFMVATAVLQCIACVMLVNDFERRNSRAKRVSVGTLRLLNTFDFYICMSNLDKFAFNSTAVGIVTIPYAILSLHYEFKLIYVVQSIQEKLSIGERKIMGTINSITIMCSFVAIFISILTGKGQYVYLLLGLSQLPQVLQNYFVKLKHRWNCCILLPLTLPKILYECYMLTYSKNVLRMLPNPDLFMITCGLIFFQCFILLIQTRRSRLCQKDIMDYTFSSIADLKGDMSHEVCSICLDKLTEPSMSVTHIEEENNEEVNKKALLENQARGVLITTSCNHSFHESCLRDWLELKFECPYCRKNVPPLPDDEY